MTTEKKQEYSQITLTNKRSSQTTGNELRSLVPPTTFKSLGSQSFTAAPVIIIIDDDDDDEKETIVPKEEKKKQPKAEVSWWDGYNRLNSVVKGSPKSKDAAPIMGSWFSSTTNLPETKTKRSLSSVHHGNVIDLCKNESYSDGYNKENQDHVGYGHLSVEDYGVSVVEPWSGGFCIKDVVSPLDSSSSYSSSNNLLEWETNTKKDVIVGEGSTSSNTGNRHVSIEELGVSVEDLKRLPWEAFDPTWEIRSETMDPWLGG